MDVTVKAAVDVAVQHMEFKPLAIKGKLDS